MKKYFFVVAAVFSSQLFAQDSTGISLDEVIITANKYPKKQSETGKVVSIITNQQLEKSGNKTIGELLNSIVGTNIIGANNNLGTNITPSIRGAAAGNVLILLDGIPVNDPSVIANYFDLNFINPDQVERIEILKGGQSTLYGSDAVAGVINIIPKKGEKNKFNINGNFSAGSYNTLKESIGINGKLSVIDYLLNYSHINADGFSAAYDENRSGTFDKDGFNQHALNSQIGIAINNKFKVVLTGMYNRYKTDLDAAGFLDEKDFTATNTNKIAGTAFIYSYKKGNLHLKYNYNETERIYINDSSYKSSPYVDYSKGSYKGKTDHLEAYFNINNKLWEILSGIDYRINSTHQSYYSIGAFGPYTPPVLKASMNQLSPYSSFIYKNNKGFNIEMGSRLNIHSAYGTNISFTLNPSLQVKQNIKIFGNLYSAFKTPTLYQLFDPEAGNGLLTPEKGIIGEAGIEAQILKNLKGRIVGFYRNTNDAIIYSFNPVTFESKFINTARQTNYGTEAEINYQHHQTSIAVNYTFTNGKTFSTYDGTGSPIGKDTSYFNLYRIPKHVLNVNAGIQLSKRLYAGTQIHAVSNREEFIYGSTPEILKGYVLVDVYSEYNFDRTIKLYLDLRNITNKKYFDFSGYNTRRFNFSAGIRFNIR